MRALCVTMSGWLTLTLAAQQQHEPERKPRPFEAASVKPVDPSVVSRRGAGVTAGIGQGRIHFPAITLKTLLIDAYAVKEFQIRGPGWIDEDRFAVDATMAPDTTRAELRMMLQSLLAERFKLAVHRESKELPTYALVVGKSGPRLKESDDAPPQKDDRDSDADGFPISAVQATGGTGTWSFALAGQGNRIGGQRATMQDLADELTRRLRCPVTNATGLNGKYDFTVTFSFAGLGGRGSLTGAPLPAEQVQPASPSGPETRDEPPGLFDAIQSQLGLRLEPRTAPVELIVVDSALRKPTEN